MLLSPSDVMDPIWGDYGDGGRDDQRVSRRKKWTPQTNQGRNDKKFGRNLISFLLQRSFVSLPHSSIVNFLCLYFLKKKEHSSFRQ